MPPSGMAEQQAPEYLSVTVHPRAKRDLLVQIGPTRFEAWVRVKPIGGAANQAVIELVARAFQLPVQRLRLIKGQHHRQKLLRLL